MNTRTASCTCGELRVEVTGEPIRVSVCHCDECQRRTGSVFGVQARFPREAVQIKGQGTEFIRTNDEGESIGSHFVQRVARRYTTSRKAESSTSPSQWAVLPTLHFLHPRFRCMKKPCTPGLSCRKTPSRSDFAS